MLPLAVFVVRLLAMYRLVIVVALAVIMPAGLHGQARQMRVPRSPAGTNITIAAPVTQRSTPSIFTLPITVSDVSGQGVIAFQFVLSYNASIIDPFGPNFGCSTSGISAGAGQTATCNVQPDGTLRVSVSGANAMAGSGTVLNLTFRTDTSAIIGDVSPLNFSAVHFYNPSGEIASGFSNGSVTLTSGPTSAMVSISGRLVSQEGRAIRGGEVVLLDDAGKQRRVSIAARGEFRFDDVAAGKTYTLTASSRRFRFEPVVLDLTDDVVSLDLVGQSLP